MQSEPSSAEVLQNSEWKAENFCEGGGTQRLPPAAKPATHPPEPGPAKRDASTRTSKEGLAPFSQLLPTVSSHSDDHPLPQMAHNATGPYQNSPGQKRAPTCFPALPCCFNTTVRAPARGDRNPPMTKQVPLNPSHPT